MMNEGTPVFESLIASQEIIISKWQKELLDTHVAIPTNKCISESLLIHCQTLRILKELAKDASSSENSNIVDGGEFS